MTDVSLVYVTAPDLTVAKRIADHLVSERLAACANLLPQMHSTYWWEGKVCREEEVVLILKTRTELVDELVREINVCHPYQCPCAVALPVTTGNPGFLAWIAAETRPVTKS